MKRLLALLIRRPPPRVRITCINGGVRITT